MEFYIYLRKLWLLDARSRVIWHDLSIKRATWFQISRNLPFLFPIIWHHNDCKWRKTFLNYFQNLCFMALGLSSFSSQPKLFAHNNDACQKIYKNKGAAADTWPYWPGSDFGLCMYSLTVTPTYLLGTPFMFTNGNSSDINKVKKAYIIYYFFLFLVISGLHINIEDSNFKVICQLQRLSSFL